MSEIDNSSHTPAPFRAAVLGSGSQANSWLFEHGPSRIAVDNGYSPEEFFARAEAAGFAGKRLDAILLTHLHGDHSRGVRRLSRVCKCRVFVHSELDLSPWARKRPPITRLAAGDTATIGSFMVRPIPAYHDYPGSSGWLIEASDTKSLVLTDTGHTDALMLETARKCSILCIEANYDEVSLQNGPYTEELRERIAGDLGHLSNQQCIDFLRQLEAGEGPVPQVFLVHLSANNNSPELLARQIAEAGFARLRVTICERDQTVLLR